MIIKIIKNCPPDENCSDISEFIDREFEVNENDFFTAGIFDDKNGVYIEELDLIVYEGEYEIIE